MDYEGKYAENQEFHKLLRFKFACLMVWEALNHLNSRLQ